MNYERIDILEIQLNKIKNEELQERAIRASGGRSTEYIVLIDKVEVALLSYEDWSDRSEGFIYEIFVLAGHRNNGIGSLLLKFAEKKALELNCNKIILEPQPFDHTVNFSFLVGWYSKNGYQQCSLNSNRMFKLI
ncbi:MULTISPECIES: GNAT family N-acetyltransferase [Providencia]|uniref:GNAT family N-acetyltransferase n=1 Tax=Providencia TaxID=586 RepID=UPI0018C74023|nr:MULTISPECIES: GNAT family N-acetyltransferase [Providencia]MBG5899634.1 GNAT family N-acetyltransferase [Providencia rettgeri]